MGHRFINFKEWLQQWNLHLFFELWVFSLIFYFFHYFWLAFSGPVSEIPFIASLSDLIGRLLLFITPPVLKTFLHMDLSTNGMSILLPNDFSMVYGFDLSGIKQMMTVVLLFLLISGPWKKKLWFLPFNLFILLILVCFRFIVLTVHCSVHPEHFYVLQAILFGPMFYFELIIMWMVWVLFIAKTGCGDFEMPDILRRPKMIQPAKN